MLSSPPAGTGTLGAVSGFLSEELTSAESAWLVDILARTGLTSGGSVVGVIWYSRLSDAASDLAVSIRRDAIDCSCIVRTEGAGEDLDLWAVLSLRCLDQHLLRRLWSHSGLYLVLPQEQPLSLQASEDERLNVWSIAEQRRRRAMASLIERYGSVVQRGHDGWSVDVFSSKLSATSFATAVRDTARERGLDVTFVRTHRGIW